jgi:hypothetical protein
MVAAVVGDSLLLSYGEAFPTFHHLHDTRLQQRRLADHLGRRLCHELILF